MCRTSHPGETVSAVGDLKCSEGCLQTCARFRSRVTLPSPASECNTTEACCHELVVALSIPAQREARHLDRFDLAANLERFTCFTFRATSKRPDRRASAPQSRVHGTLSADTPSADRRTQPPARTEIGREIIRQSPCPTFLTPAVVIAPQRYTLLGTPEPTRYGPRSLALRSPHWLGTHRYIGHWRIGASMRAWPLGAHGGK